MFSLKHVTIFLYSLYCYHITFCCICAAFQTIKMINLYLSFHISQQNPGISYGTIWDSGTSLYVTINVNSLSILSINIDIQPHEYSHATFAQIQSQIVNTFHLVYLICKSKKDYLRNGDRNSFLISKTGKTMKQLLTPILVLEQYQP